MSTTRTATTTHSIAHTLVQAMIALAVVVTAWAAWGSAASAYEPIPIDPPNPWETEPVPFPVEPIPYPTPEPTPWVPLLPEDPFTPSLPFDPGDLEILPLYPTSGSVNVHCYSDTAGGIQFTAHNHTSPFLEFFEGEAYEVSDHLVPLYSDDTILGSGGSASFVVGNWSNGTEVVAKLTNGGDTLAEGTWTIDCGTPNPAASHTTVCLSPGGAHTWVELTNTGTAAAQFTIEFIPTDPGADGATSDGVVVLPGGNHTYDRPVVNGATYHLTVTAVGESAPLIDTTFTVDCVFADDTAPAPAPPDPTPAPSDPAPAPSDPTPAPASPAPASPGGSSDPAPADPGGSSDPAPADPGGTDDGDTPGDDESNDDTDGEARTDDGSAEGGDGSAEGGHNTAAESADGGGDPSTGVDESAAGSDEAAVGPTVAGNEGGGNSTMVVVGLLAAVGLALLAAAALMHARSRRTV